MCTPRGWGLLLTLALSGVLREVAVGQVTAPTWVRVAEHAAWAPRDSCGEVVHDGKMWLLGGWFTVQGLGPNDVWCSADGADWRLVTSAAPWVHGDLPTSLAFGDRIWMIGGWYGDHQPFASSSNQAWASRDGVNWELVASGPWKPRLGAAGVVFRDHMWILGGVERYFDGEQYLLNDVWSSSDGAHWDLMAEHAPWAPRAFHGAVVLGEHLCVFGGGNYRPTYLGYNDVWRTTDGVHWDRLTEAAPWSPRIWFSAVQYRGRMWILGGWSDNPSVNWNDVWYSADGAHWDEAKTPTVWSPRHEQSAFVFQDKLWIVGGNEWPLVNDVWYLDLPSSWPAP